MWILAGHHDVDTPLAEERIQSQNLGETLQKCFLLLPEADNVVGRMPKPSAASAPASASAPRPFRPIQISEQSISGSHAWLTFDRTDNADLKAAPVTLTDKSSFGTFVNGEKVHKAAKVSKRCDVHLLTTQ